jgi:hypothetical protein
VLFYYSTSRRDYWLGQQKKLQPKHVFQEGKNPHTLIFLIHHLPTNLLPLLLGHNQHQYKPLKIGTTEQL